MSTTYDEAVQVHDGLRRRLKDLQEHSIPNLRDCKGPLAFQQQLAAEIRDDIDIFNRELQRLDALVDDQVTEKDRLKVADWVEETTEMIQHVKKDYRAALLTSKRNIDTQSKSYRDELLRSSVVASSSKPSSSEKLRGDDALMKASNDVTEAFRRTTTLMQQELERSVLTQQIFDESSRTLSATSDLYTSFSTLLNTSKSLVTALERSDTLDRLLITASLLLFFTVVAYIVKKRVVDKGLGLAFWWLKYLPQRRSATEVQDALRRTGELFEQQPPVQARTITPPELNAGAETPVAGVEGLGRPERDL
ncbi:hypothetical protein FRC04_011002 [Tulasnella sp. 424]|nr:hypothetical protein FRC04_011002 [Tulasnella sp. 424]KAG8972164.1 hypothetical protein FRC05_010333 [Tulasnella sp. 425]